jgi:tetratricopeptide (TPR) repeat protein
MGNVSLERKKELQEPDEFIVLVSRVVEYAKANQKSIINGICTILIFVLVLGGYKFYSQTKEDKASIQFSNDIMWYDKETRANKDAVSLQAIKDKADSFFKYYSRTAVAPLALARYAGLLFEKGNYADALAYYTKLLRSVNGDAVMKNMALCSIGQCHEAMNNPDQAVAVYEKVIAGKSDVRKDEALFHLAAIYESKGDKTKSRDAFAKITTDYPESLYKDLAKEKI